MEESKALEQEPKTAHWRYKTIRGEKVPCCSRCGLDNGTYYEFKFCPNCGARMIESEVQV